MQPVQQLQWKKSQAQTRLLSRKRKLAELFTVTASETGQDYKSKLRAFQDANDLERGRHFDETTLPPRIQITRLPRKSHPLQTAKSPVKPSPTSQQQLSPPKGESFLSPPTIGEASLPAKRLRSRSRSKGPEDTPLKPEIKSIQGLAGASKLVEDGKALLHPELEDGITSRPADSNFLSPPPQSKPAATATIPTSVDEKRSSISNKGSRGSSPAKQAASTPDKRRRSRSPLVLAPVSTAEVQLSPASTSGPTSSNTPIQVAGSPDTSPEEERHTPTSNESLPGKPSGADALGTPKRPETPDSTQGRPDHDPSSSSMDTDMIEPSPILEDVPPTLEPTSQAMSQSQDATANKPAIKINTQTDIASYFKPHSSSIVESPAPIVDASTTPRRAPPTTPSIQDSSKRSTRISSGVLQKKSVSEILGETPKANSPQLDSPVTSDARDAFNLATSQGRNADRERREKERSKLSTVVFAKPQKPQGENDTIELSRADPRNSHNPMLKDRDYLYTLFENKAHSMTRQGSIGYLIQNAHKTLSTADHLVDYQLQAECRILKRLYQLQEKQRWPLRQYKRADEAPRPTSHWDFILDHAKWMRTDFREERKWKLAAARGLAECCAEWVDSSPEQRKLLQVKVKPIAVRELEAGIADTVMEDGSGLVLSSHSTPELMASHEEDSVSDELVDPRDIAPNAAPAAIFSLAASDFSFSVDRTPAFDKLLNELPLYEPARIEPDLSKSRLAENLDARWRTDIVPVSRFTTEKIHVTEFKPPVKRSRYDYELETAPMKKSSPLPPQDTNVALFMAENKHIRDRIHPGHSFRPPSEYPMPTQAFFETRSSSQWTLAEDDELRKLVKDYSYNWSLISSCLSPRSLYASGADRRTPWECFERWIGLEGLPADMSKTPYFKTYSGRIEAAGRNVAAQIEEAQRRAGANVQLAARKRTTQPVRVERKRTQRHLAMLDAMRKLAKKRESAIQKQQHQADLAAMRKVNEVNQPKAPFSKPSEFAALKLEREQKLAERQEIYRQQLIAHQRATAQAARGQNAQAGGMPNGMPQNGGVMRGPPSVAGMPGVHNGNLQVPNGHPRPHPQMMGVPNGMPMQPGMVVPKGLAQAQAQMQANLARGVATSPQQMRILQEANKVQQEQMMRQAQQAQGGVHSSPTGPHASLANGKGANNPAYMAALAMANGVPSPSGPMNGNASSPRSQGAATAQALSSGHIPVLTQIANKIRENYPQMSDEDVQKHASQQIQAWQQQATTAAVGQVPKRPPTHNQAAVNAAMGAANAAAHASNAAAAAAAVGYGQTMMTNEQVQQYNQRMRMHQAQQHAARGMPGQMPPGMVAAMTNSPVMNMARPVSQHTNQGQMSRSATPRDQGNGGQGQQGSPRPGSQAMQT